MMPFYHSPQTFITLLLIMLLMSGCATSAVRANYAKPHYEKSQIKAMVTQEAARIGVPISLGLAVAKAESDFNPYALSSAGARGVMQIMPATAEKEYGIHRNRLWEPRLNIRLGLHFLKRLINRYQGRVDLALSYYNGGSAVGDLPNARIIPATYGYVRKVMKLQQRYQRSRT